MIISAYIITFDLLGYFLLLAFYYLLILFLLIITLHFTYYIFHKI